MSTSWLVEATAARSRVTIHPVRHLAVHGGDGWVLWCSSGKATADYNPQSSRFCRPCRELAREAVQADELDPADVNGWDVGQPPTPN